MTLQFALAYLKSLMLTPDRGGMEGAIAVLLPAHAALEQELIAARAELQTQKHNALAGLMAAAAFAAEDEARLKAALAAERVENQRLRDAFVAMEKAYNQREAEVERAFRAGLMAGYGEDDIHPVAAWTRYQQERQEP
jgi:hypothetical protein